MACHEWFLLLRDIVARAALPTIPRRQSNHPLPSPVLPLVAQQSKQGVCGIWLTYVHVSIGAMISHLPQSEEKKGRTHTRQWTRRGREEETGFVLAAKSWCFIIIFPRRTISISHRAAGERRRYIDRGCYYAQNGWGWERTLDWNASWGEEKRKREEDDRDTTRRSLSSFVAVGKVDQAIVVEGCC